MPVPRRFDRSLPERDSTRTNDRIRVPEVRLIGSDGEQVGIVKTAEALRYAQERELDLVEVAPGAKPPVCRVLDYSKYKYEQNQRQKAARKHQTQITVREIKFRPKIAQHDYDTKKGHVERFLKAKDKVKVTIMFRGREVAHPERGEIILNRLAEELEELAQVDQRPIVDGRNMTMLLAPLKGRDETDAPAQPTKASGGKDSRRSRRREEDDTGEHEVVAPAAKAAPAAADAPEPEAAEAQAPEATAPETAAAAPEPETAAAAPEPVQETAPAPAEPETAAPADAAPAATEPAAPAKAEAPKAKKAAAKTASKPAAKTAAKKPAAKGAAKRKPAAKKPAAS